MNNFYILIFIFISAAGQSLYASVLSALFLPEKISTYNKPAKDTVRIKDRKLSFLQKTGVALFRHKLFRNFVTGNEATPKQLKQGKWSMILGLSSILAVFIPYGFIFALPAAIIAIIAGGKSLRGNKNKFGKMGLIAGIVSVVLMLAAVALHLVLLSSTIQ